MPAVASEYGGGYSSGGGGFDWQKYLGGSVGSIPPHIRSMLSTASAQAGPAILESYFRPIWNAQGADYWRHQHGKHSANYWATNDYGRTRQDIGIKRKSLAQKKAQLAQQKADYARLHGIALQQEDLRYTDEYTGFNAKAEGTGLITGAQQGAREGFRAAHELEVAEKNAEQDMRNRAIDADIAATNLMGESLDLEEAVALDSLKKARDELAINDKVWGSIMQRAQAEASLGALGTFSSIVSAVMDRATEHAMANGATPAGGGAAAKGSSMSMMNAIDRKLPSSVTRASGILPRIFPQLYAVPSFAGFRAGGGPQAIAGMRQADQRMLQLITQRQSTGKPLTPGMKGWIKANKGLYSQHKNQHLFVQPSRRRNRRRPRIVA